MNPKMKKGWLTTLVLVGVVTVGLAGCAKKSYIDIDYRLPSTAGTLPGRIAFVETSDQRGDPKIFNERAEKKFEHFTGLFALSMDAPGVQEGVIGAYPLPALFETVLKKRLQQLDVRIAEKKTPDVPVFHIRIDQFRINLVGQKWLADVSYEASLVKAGHSVARELVSGRAERVKVMGSGGAETVIAEIFTDAMNRLNIERLFDQAGL